nr:PREDICTED: ras association domain-containing protein 5 [Opisthocomus hoazin]
MSVLFPWVTAPDLSFEGSDTRVAGIPPAWLACLRGRERGGCVAGDVSLGQAGLGGSVRAFRRCAPENVTQTAEEEKPKPLTIQEIKQKIEKYNAKVTNCLLMKLNDDGTYTGFIKVHLKLRRPVTVPAGIRPQSIYDALKEVNLADMTDKRTSFYLPLDAIKQLHISSTTTVSEVIQGLLKKFMVVDNPQKFALFKEMRKDGQVGCILHPRATELLDDTGQRRKGQNSASAKEVREVQTETATDLERSQRQAWITLREVLGIRLS